MTTQTTYSERISPPVPGVIAGNMDNAKVTTGICETAEPGIGFGLAVSEGASSDEGVVLGGTLAGLRGCSVRDITLRGDVPSADLDHYVPADSVAVLERGDIWVAPAHAVAAHDAVYFNTTTGLWSNQASGNLGPVPGAYFKTSCGTGGAAILSLAGGRAA